MPPSVAIIESHEDRIQRLESDIPELTAQVTTVAGKVETVCDQQQELGKKMDSLSVMMGAHAKSSAENFEKVLGRVDVLEKSKLQLEGVKKFMSWALKPALLIGGAILAQFGQVIFVFLQHLGH